MIKKLVAYFLIFSISGALPIAQAALSPSDQATIHSIVNLPVNPGFENGSVGWSASAGTFAVTTSTGAHTGKNYGGWQAAASTAAPQTFLSTSTAIPSNLKGQNCVAGLYYEGNTATAANGVQQFVVEQSSTVIASVSLPTSSGWGFQLVNFVCPSSGNLQIGLATTATTSSSGQNTIIVDDLFVMDAKNFNIGSSPVITAWQSYSMTVGAVTTAPTFGTTTTNVARYAQSGDSMSMSFDLVQTSSGTAGSGIYLFPIPSGLTIDTTKISSAASALAQGVRGSGFINSGSNSGVLVPYIYDSTHVALKVSEVTSAGTGSVNSLGQGSDFQFNQSAITLSFSMSGIPIAGWGNAITYQASSGGLAVGDETYTRDQNGNCPIGTLKEDGSAVSRISYAALFNDIGTTYGSGDGSTTFNLPNAQGIFQRGSGSQTISGITYTGTLGTTQGDQMQGHVHLSRDLDNGNSPVKSVSETGSGGNAVYSNGGTNGSGLSSADPSTDGTNGTPRIGPETRPANDVHTGCIRYVPASPTPVIVGTPVYARYVFVNNGAIPNNSSATLSSTYATYTKIKDSLNLLNTTTGVITIMQPGMYRVSLRVSAQPSATAGQIVATITQGGSSTQGSSEGTPLLNGTISSAQVTDDFYCAYGDTLTLGIYQNSGSSLGIFSSTVFNSVSIEWVGN